MPPRRRGSHLESTLAAVVRGAAVALVLAASACGLGVQRLLSHCDEQGACPPCQADADCHVASNPCHAVAYCTHKDSNLAVNMIGCNFERARPPPEACGCVEQRCRAK